MSEKKKQQEDKLTSKVSRPRPIGALQARPSPGSQPDFPAYILEAARSLEGQSFSSADAKREALVDRVVDLVGGSADQRADLRDFLLLLIETDPRLSEWD
jgi:hypothetical protein